MGLIVWTVVGAVAMVSAYAFGLGGPTCAIIFLTFLTIGVTLRAARPIIDWATRPS